MWSKEYFICRRSAAFEGFKKFIRRTPLVDILENGSLLSQQRQLHLSSCIVRPMTCEHTSMISSSVSGDKNPSGRVSEFYRMGVKI